MKISWKNIENWCSWKMRFFWGCHFEFFKSAILIAFCFISVKKAAHFYEVSFFPALWMVFPESWKRRSPNFYAHDCMYQYEQCSVYVLCNIDLLCKVWVGWLTICVCVFRQFAYYVIHQSREKLQGNKSTVTIISNFVQKSGGIFKLATYLRGKQSF